jgi:hypothetical protein
LKSQRASTMSEKKWKALWLEKVTYFLTTLINRCDQRYDGMLYLLHIKS